MVHSLTMRVGTGFDIVGFGHKDGLIGAYCVAAVNALAQLKEWRGDAAGANTSRATHRRAVATYLLRAIMIATYPHSS